MLQELLDQTNFSLIDQVSFEQIQDWIELKAFILRFVKNKPQKKSSKEYSQISRSQTQFQQDHKIRELEYLKQEISSVTFSGYRLIDLKWTISISFDKKQIYINCKFSQLDKAGFEFRPLLPSFNIQLQQILKEISKEASQPNLKIFLGNDGLIHSSVSISLAGNLYKLHQAQVVFKNTFKACKNLMTTTLPKIINFMVSDTNQYYQINHKKHNQRLKQKQKQIKIKNQQIQQIQQVQQNKIIQQFTKQNQQNIQKNYQKNLQLKSNSSDKNQIKLKKLYQQNDQLEESIHIRIVVNKCHYAGRTIKNQGQQIFNFNESGSLIGNIQKLQFNSSANKFISKVSSIQSLIFSTSQKTNQIGVIAQKLKNAKSNILKRKRAQEDLKYFLEEIQSNQKQPLIYQNEKKEQLSNSPLRKNKKIVEKNKEVKSSKTIQDQDCSWKNKKIPKFIMTGVHILNADKKFLIKISNTKNSSIEARYYQFTFAFSINNFARVKSSQIQELKVESKQKIIKSILVHKMTVQEPNSNGFFNISKESYENQKAMLQFLRNQTCPYLAKYYLRVYKEGQKAISNDKIYMEYYKKSLFQLLKESKHYQSKIKLSLKSKLSIFKGIVKGVIFLYNRKIIHRDLKPLNIMISNNLCPKIIDFGSCYTSQQKNSKFIVAQPRLMSTQGYYINYMKIKDQNIKLKYSSYNQYYRHQKFDIYSLGKILANIFEEEMGYDHDFKRQNQIRDQLLNIYSLCTAIDPDNRLNPELVLFLILKLEKQLNFSNQLDYFKQKKTLKQQVGHEIRQKIEIKSLYS